MPRKPGDPNYTIEQKAHALAILNTEAKGNYRQTERLTGISAATISKAENNPEIREISKSKIAELGLGFQSLTAKLLAKYDKLADEADLSNKGVTLLGIAADKALLYSGQPNQIVQTHDNGPYLQQLIAKGFGEDEARAILEEAARRQSDYNG